MKLYRRPRDGAARVGKGKKERGGMGGEFSWEGLAGNGNLHAHLICRLSLTDRGEGGRQPTLSLSLTNGGEGESQPTHLLSFSLTDRSGRWGKPAHLPSLSLTDRGEGDLLNGAG